MRKNSRILKLAIRAASADLFRIPRCKETRILSHRDLQYSDQSKRFWLSRNSCLQHSATWISRYNRTCFLVQIYLLQVNRRQQPLEIRKVWHQLLAKRLVPSDSGTTWTSKWSCKETLRILQFEHFTEICKEVFKQDSSLSTAEGTQLIVKQNCMVELSRNQVSEMHFDNFKDFSSISVLEDKFQDRCVFLFRLFFGCYVVDQRMTPEQSHPLEVVHPEGNYLKGMCTIPSCGYWHPPDCQNSQKGIGI